MSDRLSPEEAELAVLGGCLYKNENLDKIPLLEEGDFSVSRHATVFRALRELHGAGSPADEVTVWSYLQGRQTFRLTGTESEADAVGGLAFLSSLALRCPDSNSVVTYASIVKEASELRRLRTFGANLHDAVTRGTDLTALRAMLEHETSRVGSAVFHGGAPATLADVSLEGFSPGLASGVGLERYVPGGIPRDKVTVLFGEQGSFKTTVKNAIMFSMARGGYRCLDVSLEDSSSLTVARYLAQVYDLPYGKIAAGQVEIPPLSTEDRDVLGRLVDGSKLAPRMAELVAIARSAKVSAVFVDYIQLLEGCSDDHTELAEAMRLAQLSAARDKIAYVLISQVKQDVHYRARAVDKSGRPLGSPRPTIRDTFGSAAVSTCAKLGLGVFRPWAYCPVPTSETGPFGEYCKWFNSTLNMEKACEDYSNMLELIIDKNVLGEAPSTVRLLVDKPTGRIEVYPELV